MLGSHTHLLREPSEIMSSVLIGQVRKSSDAPTLYRCSFEPALGRVEEDECTGHNTNGRRGCGESMFVPAGHQGSQSHVYVHALIVSRGKHVDSSAMSCLPAREAHPTHTISRRADYLALAFFFDASPVL